MQKTLPLYFLQVCLEYENYMVCKSEGKQMQPNSHTFIADYIVYTSDHS